MTQEVKNVEDVRLTPELLAKLRGYMGLEPNESFPYIPKVFREKDEGVYLIPLDYWPVFLLKGLDGLDEPAVADASTIFEEDIPFKMNGMDIPMRKPVIQAGKMRVETLRRGLRGWKNLFREDLKTEIVFNPKWLGKDGLLHEDAIRVLPFYIQLDLQLAISNRSILTKEERAGLDY